MALGFEVHGGIKHLIKRAWVAGAQGRAQINVIFLTKAHVKRAGAGHAHAVATFAEIMGQRRDKAEPSAGFSHGGIAGRAGCDVFGRDQGVFLFEPFTHRGQRQVLVGPVPVNVAKRHGFDQAKIIALLAAPGDKA